MLVPDQRMLRVSPTHDAKGRVQPSHEKTVQSVKQEYGPDAMQNIKPTNTAPELDLSSVKRLALALRRAFKRTPAQL